MPISVVLFDVDGTIVDSAPAVIDAFRGALSDFGLPFPDERRLRSYVGPPLWHSFADLGYSGPLLSDLVDAYRRRYQRHFLDPEPFAGVIDLLHELRHAGVRLATATSKQAPMAFAQIKHLGLADVFDVVAGATPDPSSCKATVINEAVARLGELGADVSCPVLVGDSVWDVRGAREAGIGVIGVGWGYGTPEDLAEADATCATVVELRDLLLGGASRHACSSRS